MCRRPQPSTVASNSTSATADTGASWSSVSTEIVMRAARRIDRVEVVAGGRAEREHLLVRLGARGGAALEELERRAVVPPGALVDERGEVELVHRLLDAGARFLRHVVQLGGRRARDRRGLHLAELEAEVVRAVRAAVDPRHAATGQQDRDDRDHGDTPDGDGDATARDRPAARGVVGAARSGSPPGIGGRTLICQSEAEATRRSEVFQSPPRRLRTHRAPCPAWG